MNRPGLFRYAGWSAYLSAAVTVVGLVTLMLLLQAGPRFKTLDDVAVLALTLTRLPLPFALHAIQRTAAPRLSPLATVLSLGAILVIMAVQALILFGTLQFEQVSGILDTAHGFFGVWLILIALPGGTGNALPAPWHG